MEYGEHVEELLPAYALGILEPEEQARVQAHLAECAACRAELLAYQEVGARLPLGAADYAPPAGLKQAILRQARQPAIDRAAPEARKPILGWLARLGPVWAAAGLVLILALAVSNLLLWREVRQLTQAQGQQFLTVGLQGMGGAPGASGLLVVSPDGRYGTLVVDGLPAPAAGKEYQLWLTRDGERDNGGLIQVNQAGYGSLLVYSRAPLRSYQSFGVTLEPLGGSPGPTGPKVLGGSF